MKKKILILILAILAVAVCFTACTNNNPDTDDSGSTVGIKSLAIVAGTAPTEVTVGEQPDFSKLMVLVTYDDDTTKNVGASELVISPVDTSTPGTKTVTVSYGTKMVSFKINVVDKTAILESINIVAGSVASTVKRGSVYDTSKLQVEGVYSDGTTRGIAIADVTVSAIDTSSAGDKTLTVSYNDKTASMTVKVIDFAGMSVVTGTVADKINVGEALDTSKIKVIVKYNDANTQDDTVEAADLVIGTIDTTTIGEKELTITYKGYTITYSVEVVGPVSVSVMNTESFNREVMVFSTLNTAGVKAEVTYSDGTKRVFGADALTFGTIDTTSAGVKKLTVKFGNLETEVDITVVGVKSMTVSGYDTEIFKGDTFVDSNIKATVIYTNDKVETKDFNDLTIDGNINGNTAGDQTFTVKFLDGTAECKVKVCEITEIFVDGLDDFVQPGDKINFENLVVYGVYNDSKKTVIEIGNINSDDVTTNVEGEVVNTAEGFVLKVTYGDRECQERIPTTPPSLKEIFIESCDENVRMGEEYRDASVVVYAKYVDEDGNEGQKRLTKGVVVGIVDSPTKGYKTLTVTYTYTENGEVKTATATKTVKVIGIKSIAVVNGTLPTLVNKGEPITTGGVKIVVTFDDNETKDVSEGITVTVPETLVPGADNKLTVTYMGVSTTHVCHVKKVTAIEIFAGLGDVKRDGYETDVSNLQLKIKYSNNTEEVVNESALVGVEYTGLEEGNVNFSVTYEGITVSKTLVKAEIYQVHALNGTVPGHVFQGNAISYEKFKLTVIYKYTYNGVAKEEVYLIGVDDKNLTVTPDSIDTTTTGDRIIQFRYISDDWTASAKIVVIGVQSIDIVPGTVLTSVIVGQPVDDTKIQVRVNYTDGTYEYVSRSNLKSVTTVDTSTKGTKELTVTYAGYNQDFTATVFITVSELSIDADNGDYFAAFLPDEILVRESYKKNFKIQDTPYYVGDDNAFYLYLNVAMLDNNDKLVDVDGKSVPTAVKVYEIIGADEKELTGSDRDAVVAFSSVNNSYDFTEAAIGRTFRLEVSPADENRYFDVTAVTSSHTVKIVDGYNIYHAYELNIISNGYHEFDGEGMTDDLKFKQDVAVNKFLESKGLSGITNLAGVVLHKNIDIKPEDLPSEYIVPYTKDGKTYEGLVDALGIFNRQISVGQTFSIYGNCYSIFSYNIPAVAHQGYGNNDDPYSSATLFEIEPVTAQLRSYTNDNPFPFESLKFNVVDLALRDNDPHSNDQSASERHMRGLSAFQVGGCEVNMTNVNIDAFMMSMSTEEDNLTINLNKVKFYNAWQGHLFLWSNNCWQDAHGDEAKKQAPWNTMYGIKVNITDSLLGKCGGPVILAQNANREYASNQGLNIDVVADKDSQLFSYVTGEEAWFVAVNQVAMAKKIILANQLVTGYSEVYNNRGMLPSKASFLSSDKIVGVPTVNMIMVVMGKGDLVGGDIKDHRGSMTIGDTLAMNMKMNDGENVNLKNMDKDYPGQTYFQAPDNGAIAYHVTDGDLADTLAPYDIFYPDKGLVGPNPALFAGDYINIYTSGIGILLELYHPAN